MKDVDTILQIRLNDEFYGIDSNISNHILRVPPITAIPNTQKSLKGIVVLNGKVVPVIDFKEILGLGSVDISNDESRIVILKIENEEVAILVDEVMDAISFDKNNYEDNIVEDKVIIGFYKYNDDLIQIIDPINILKTDLIDFFKPLEVETLTKENGIKQDSFSQTRRYLFFDANNEKFAIDIELVAELIFIPNEITPIAGSEHFTLGVITLREEVIDVLDFNLIFGFEAVDIKNPKSRILILKDENKKLALCVENVEEIKDIEISKIEPIQEAFSENKIEALYKNNEEIVSIISQRYVKELIEKYSLTKNIKEETNVKKGSEFMRELAVFAIGNEEFAFDIEDVQEIITYQEVTPLPNSSEYILGVINLRGSIIPVVDLPKKLNFETKITDKSKIIVCNLEDEKVGFLVDDVNDIMFIEDKYVSIAKRTDSLVRATISLDDAKRVILELRLENIISVEELDSMKQYEEE